MRLALQPLVDALRKHVGGGFASAFHVAVLAAQPELTELHDHKVGPALLQALAGCELPRQLPLVRTYVPHFGRWVGLDPADLADRHAAAALPDSLADALAAALSAGARAHFMDAPHEVETVSLTEAEGCLAARVDLQLATLSGHSPVILAFGGPDLNVPLSKTVTIRGAALRAAGEQARQHTEGGLMGLLNDICLSMPAASGAIN